MFFINECIISNPVIQRREICQKKNISPFRRNYRQNAGTVFYLILIFISVISCSQKEQIPPEPNILFIAIDDMNDWVEVLGGNPQAKTPNINKLAKQGVLFTNAHTPAPGCSPCRNALLYGLQPHHSGLYPFYDRTKMDIDFFVKHKSLMEIFA